VTSFRLTFDDFVDLLLNFRKGKKTSKISVGIVELARKLVSLMTFVYLKLLNQKGFGVKKCTGNLQKITRVEECKDVCRKRNDCMTAKKYVELGSPLLANHKPSITQLLDFIEELRKYSSVSARGEKSNGLS
jgi:hypothetical protein